MRFNHHEVMGRHVGLRKFSQFVAKKAGWVKKLKQAEREFGLAKSQRLGDLRLMLMIRDRRFLLFHIRQK